FIVYFKEFGYSMIIPRKKKMYRDMIFDLASLTKPIVSATLTMILVENGFIRLIDKVIDFIPDKYKEYFKSDGKNKITFKNLLTHTAGFPAWLPVYTKCNSRDEVFDKVIKCNLEYNPGEKVIYSDIGIILLTYLIEQISGKRIDLLASEKIFKPLGMSNTMYNPPQSIWDNIVATEKCRYRNKILVGEVHDENAFKMNGVSGHAGLFSTAMDIAFFAQMMLNKGYIDDVQILSKKSVELMIRNHTEGLNDRRGIGWALKTDNCSCGDLFSDKSYGHTGFTGTSLWIDPVEELFVVFLTNRVHPSRENRKILRIRPLLHNIIASSIKD
ncbi:MAG TPA: serine hydrolase, partial [Thermoprotei archaeon]|nr:serine hydrolase [Thermoprotei archaeon]